MPEISRQAIVPYSPEEMYSLVNAIEDYPKFLPWCRSSEILFQSEDEIHARLEVARGVIQKSFTTCNRLQANKMIEIRLLDGPFDHLEGLWRFNPWKETGCQICFNLEFSFNSRVANFALGPVFHQLTNSLVDSFCERAKALYGER